MNPSEVPTAKPLQLASNVTLMGSGAILNEVIQAGQQLAEMAIDVTIFSVTSWSELARDGAATLNNADTDTDTDTDAFITQQLHASKGPIIAATDYVRAVPESIRAFIPPGRRYQTLGTDGFGRSDTRAALRAFFKVDAASIVTAALHQLAQHHSS